MILISGMRAILIVFALLGALFLFGVISITSKPGKKGSNEYQPTDQELFGVKTFTAGGVTFAYPATWNAEEIPMPNGDFAVRVLPATGRVDRVAMNLVVTRDPKILTAKKPIVDAGMTVHRADHEVISGEPGWYVRSSGVGPGGSYSHAASWQLSSDALHIAFAGTVSGEAGDGEKVDKQFSSLFGTIRDSALSLKYEPK